MVHQESIEARQAWDSHEAKVRQTVRESNSADFETYVQQVAKRLRLLAQDIELEVANSRCKRITTRDHTDMTHAEIARNVVHAVTWGVANLNLGTLIARAERADTGWAR
jgi:hypothetical protein